LAQEGEGRISGDQIMNQRFVYTQAPLLIYWELTRACDLACRHCRAEAVNRRDPGELSTLEARLLLEKTQCFTNPAPHIVLTGGDPLKRSDFFELLDYGTGLGLGISVAPSATNALSPVVLRRMKTAGMTSIGLSLDGSTAEKHDGFRGVAGCFQQTLAAARTVCDEGIPLQVNTLVTGDTLADLGEIYRLLSVLPLMRWKLFTLISVGRGQTLKEISPEQCEHLHHWLYDLSKEAPFPVATTEAPHFRRVVYTRQRAEGKSLAVIRQSSVGRGFGIRDGNGIMFISHTGDVYPSGFLPLNAGNVRENDVTQIYREADLFTEIRDMNRLHGKCRDCEFRWICGGSRARAYGKSGDQLASDPLCAYEPRSTGAARASRNTALSASA